ncbi:MAG: tyrosine-specific transport protein [Francisellaceae bacterium]|jgi:tyrosine-specific transport protein
MTQVSLAKKTGAALIITGTCVGAGMLVLPLVTAACGFIIASILLVVIYLLMLSTAFLIMEVNLSMPDGTNFSSMAKNTLGPIGQLFAWLSFLLLMYALTAAYTSQGASLLGLWLSHYLSINLPPSVDSLIFILAFGAFIYSGTFAVENLNKILISVKILSFIALTVVIMPHISTERILQKTPNINLFWITLPLLITSFGYHNILPSVRTYLKSNKKSLRNVILIGGTIPLIFYLLWESITLGTIPLYGEYSFQHIVNHGNNVTGLIKVYNDYYHIPAINTFTTIFTNVAITTSFLGVTLSLFNFNQDTYRLKTKNHFHKIIAFLITYTPPFLFAVYYPDGFIMALGYASIFVAIILISMPAMMAWVVREKNGSNTLFSKFYLILIMLSGFMMILLQVATQFDWLPMFK